MGKGWGGGYFRAEKVDSGGNNSWDVRFEQEVLRPVVHSSGRHHGEVILRCRRWWTFDDRNKRSRWEWQPYTGAMTDLPRTSSVPRTACGCRAETRSKESSKVKTGALEIVISRAHSCCLHLATMT